MQKPNHMQGGEFEKQVQQKMEELKFSPSEAVWSNVEKEISKEKKRRVPVFWLFFPLGLAAAVGLYFLVTPKNTEIKHVPVSSNRQASSTADQAATAPVNTDSEKSREKAGDHIVNLHEKNTSDNKPASAASGNNTITFKNNTGLILNSKKEKPGAGRQSGALNKKEVHKRNRDKNKTTTEPAIVQNAPAPGYTDQNIIADKDKAAANSNTLEQDAGNADKNASPNDAAAPADVVVNKADSASSKAVAAAKTDSAAVKQTVAKNKKNKKASPWKIGFTGAAGVGAIHQSLFNPATVPSPNYDNLMSNAAYAPVYRPSDIRPGFSFSAGAFVKKQLSRRLSFTIGLNYHYYSTSIRTGSKVDSGSSLQTSTYSLQARPSYAYYSNGEMNKYTSRYHFIELPVALQYQLNRSKKWPLTWEAGLAVSELFNTDALYFNYSTGVYYRNNDFFNKTQLSGNTALMIGFSLHKTRFAVGPQLQYGFTNMLNNKTTGKEHLFFTGLKFTIVPSWK